MHISIFYPRWVNNRNETLQSATQIDWMKFLPRLALKGLLYSEPVSINQASIETITKYLVVSVRKHG